MQKSRFRGREDTMNLIEAWRDGGQGRRRFPQGDKSSGRKTTRRSCASFLQDRNNKHKLLETIPKGKTIVRPL